MKRMAIAMSVLGLLWGCQRGHERASSSPQRPLLVNTATVRRVDWPKEFYATGTVQAQQAVTVSAKLMAVVEQVFVKAGDRVGAGQLLIKLDARQLEAEHRRAEAGLSEAYAALQEAEQAIGAAKAQLQLAEATFHRFQVLYDKQSVARQEYDEVRARWEAAKANYQMAVAKQQQVREKIRQAEQMVQNTAIMLTYTELRAPFDGVVTARHVDPGDLATPGRPLLTLERGGRYRLEVAVNESDLHQIRVGMPVNVDLDALGQSLRLAVGEVIPAVDPGSRSAAVRIPLPPLVGLYSGLYGRARFPLGTERVLAIPEKALEVTGQVRAVYVHEGGHARRRLVTTGRIHDGWVEVLSGIQEGEQVIAPIPTGLIDGSAVEVRR